MVRALARHARGQWFESTTAHHRIHIPIPSSIAECNFGVNPMPEKKPRRSAKSAERPPLPVNENGVPILSGNPQIARGDGDAPVRNTLPTCPSGKASPPWTTSSSAPSPTYARRSAGTPPSTASRARAISYHVQQIRESNIPNPHAPVERTYYHIFEEGMDVAPSGAGVGWVLGSWEVGKKLGEGSQKRSGQLWSIQR